MLPRSRGQRRYMHAQESKHNIHKHIHKQGTDQCGTWMYRMAVILKIVERALDTQC